MALTKCAVFYWTSSGVLTLKILADDDVEYDNIVVPNGQTMFLADLVQNPKQMGCPENNACRQLIGKLRGLPALTENDERAAQIDQNGNVVAVWMADPENVQPADLGGPSDHVYVKAHPLAIEGDLYDAKAAVFSRRYVIADSTSKDIASIQIVPLDSQPVLTATEIAVASATLDVGQKAPPPKTEIAVASVDTPA